MKQFYIEGRTNLGGSFFGSVVDTDINSAMKQVENLGCDVYAVRLKHTVLNSLKCINIQLGEPKPDHTLCGKCQHCHKQYREVPRGFDDEEYYTCDLRKDNHNKVNYTDFCSNGVTVE